MLLDDPGYSYKPKIRSGLQLNVRAKRSHVVAAARRCQVPHAAP